MATHSSILAWRVPWTGEPGGLQSRGSQRVSIMWKFGQPEMEHKHAPVILGPREASVLFWKFGAYVRLAVIMSFSSNRANPL